MREIRAIINSDGDYTLDGVDTFGYHSKTLNPSNVFSTKKDAKAAARAANIAFSDGEQYRSMEIRKHRFSGGGY